MIATNAIPRRNDSITEKILDDEIILYNQATHNVHSLNKTAGILWQLCDGKASVDEMINYILKACTGDKKVIETDVLKILEEMEKNHLIIL